MPDMEEVSETLERSTFKVQPSGERDGAGA